MRSLGLAKNAGKCGKNAENAAKNAIENAVSLEWCLPLETPMFHPFLNSPQNSEYFEHRQIGSNKKMSPYLKKKFSGAAGARKTYCSSQLTDYNTMPLECVLLNITLRDLPGKCEKKGGNAEKCGPHFPPPSVYPHRHRMITQIAKGPQGVVRGHPRIAIFQPTHAVLKPAPHRWGPMGGPILQTLMN